MNNWRDTLGRGAKVCLLDSGVTYRPYVYFSQIENFTHEATHVNADHGNCMAEIIASRDPLAPGIAPHCLLYAGKVWSGRALVWPHYEAGLRWVLQVGADVLNLSLAMGKLSDEFQRLLKQIDSMNTIIVAADGPQPGLAKCPYVLTAGRIGVHSSAQVRTIDSTSYRGRHGAVQTVKGTSVSAATISGLAACAKAADPKISRLDFIKLLKDTMQSVASAST